MVPGDRSSPCRQGSAALPAREESVLRKLPVVIGRGMPQPAEVIFDVGGSHPGDGLGMTMPGGEAGIIELWILPLVGFRVAIRKGKRSGLAVHVSRNVVALIDAEWLTVPPTWMSAKSGLANAFRMDFTKGEDLSRAPAIAGLAI